MTEIANIGGAGRFFGLKQLCKRLRVTSGGAPQPVMAKARGRASKKPPRAQRTPVEELLTWSKRQQGRVRAAVKQASQDKRVLPLLHALERAMFSDSVPACMQWGGSPGKYLGQHIVRKLLIKYEAEIGDMRWCKQAILGAGPDARGHLASLVAWPENMFASVFHPVPPSRLSMWACLMGQAFKLTPQARLLWQSKEGVSVDTFRRHALKLTEGSGVVPHVKQVWDSIVAESAAGARPTC